MFTRNYRDYFKTTQWHELRAHCIGRALGCCECCRADGTLHGHHLTYERFGCEDMEDILILCKKCHRTATALVRSNTVPRRGSVLLLRDLTLAAIAPRKRAFKLPMFPGNPLLDPSVRIARDSMDKASFKSALRSRIDGYRGGRNLYRAILLLFCPQSFRSPFLRRK